MQTQKMLSKVVIFFFTLITINWITFIYLEKKCMLRSTDLFLALNSLLLFQA